MDTKYNIPSHIPAHVIPTCELLLQAGGSLWTLCYILHVRESLRSKTYGMPLFALALNLAWEFVYLFYVSDKLIEQVVFAVWLFIDCGMVYGLLGDGRREWGHAPWVQRRLGSVLMAMVVVAALGHWSFAKWWIENEVGKKEAKLYLGAVGPDVTELGFWSAACSQAYLSAACLCQLAVRQHSGGVSWGIWFTRTLGSILGLYVNYGWAWWFWPEAHRYFVSPFSLFLCGTGLVCDLTYAFLLWYVKNTEKVLPDGSKVSTEMSRGRKTEKSS